MKLSLKIARNILAWSRYIFRTQLMNKAREYSNCRVIISSKCKFLHPNLGCAKMFKRLQCNQKSDIDINADRNILLKNMMLVFELDVRSLILGFF